MSRTSRVLAGVLLITFPSVIVGGVSLLYMLTNESEYAANQLRQDLWRAGHAHAGVYLILALVMLRYIDEAALSSGWKWFVRLAAPIAAILVPVAFFCSVLSPESTQPNAIINLAYVGGVILALGLVRFGGWARTHDSCH